MKGTEQASPIGVGEDTNYKEIVRRKMAVNFCSLRFLLGSLCHFVLELLLDELHAQQVRYGAARQHVHLRDDHLDHVGRGDIVRQVQQ